MSHSTLPKPLAYLAAVAFSTAVSMPSAHAQLETLASFDGVPTAYRSVTDPDEVFVARPSGDLEVYDLAGEQTARLRGDDYLGFDDFFLFGSVLGSEFRTGAGDRLFSAAFGRDGSQRRVLVDESANVLVPVEASGFETLAPSNTDDRYYVRFNDDGIDGVVYNLSAPTTPVLEARAQYRVYDFGGDLGEAITVRNFVENGTEDIYGGAIEEGPLYRLETIAVTDELITRRYVSEVQGFGGDGVPDIYETTRTRVGAPSTRFRLLDTAGTVHFDTLLTAEYTRVELVGYGGTDLAEVRLGGDSDLSLYLDRSAPASTVPSATLGRFGAFQALDPGPNGQPLLLAITRSEAAILDGETFAPIATLPRSRTIDGATYNFKGYYAGILGRADAVSLYTPERASAPRSLLLLEDDGTVAERISFDLPTAASLVTSYRDGNGLSFTFFEFISSNGSRNAFDVDIFRFGATSGVSSAYVPLDARLAPSLTRDGRVTLTAARGGEYEVAVFDVAGRLVGESRIPEGETVRLPAATGLYAVRVRDRGARAEIVIPVVRQ